MKKIHLNAFNVFDTVVILDDDYIVMNDMKDYYTFILSEDFRILRSRAIDILKKVRKFENLDLTKLFLKTGLCGTEKVKISGTLLTFEKMLFSNIISSIEKEVGTLLLKQQQFKDFSEIYKFQSVFKAITEFFYDRYLVNFTIQQHEHSVQIKKDFEENEKQFKQYLKKL